MLVGNMNFLFCISAAPLQLPMPSPAASSGKMQRKISLSSSFGLNKEGSDSGADTTPRATKLSPATLSRHRAESSGYDSIVRDSETSSIASDSSSRQTGALQEHQGNSISIFYRYLRISVELIFSLVIKIAYLY